MNFLAIKLFIAKYYDLVFLFGFSSIAVLSYFFSKSDYKKKVVVGFSKIPLVYFLILFLLLGFFVRLYKINNPVADWHSFRQADTASVARIYVEEGINLLFPRYHDISRVQSGLFNPKGYRFVEFPIYNAFQALLTQSTGILSLEIWGRLISVFSALLSSVLIFSLGKRFISAGGGLLAAASYLFLPYNVYFTRVILPEPLGITFALAALVFFVKFLDNEKYSYLFLSALFFSLALLIKPYFVFYIVPLIYLAFEKYSFKVVFRQKKFYIFAILTLLPLLLWRIWMRQFPEGIPFWTWTFNGDAIRFRPAFWYWIFGERLTKLILGYLGIVPFVMGLFASKRSNKFIQAFLAGMFLYVSTFATANVRHDYYQSIIIPAVSLCLASGFLTLWNTKGQNKYRIRVFLVVCLIFMLVTGAYQVKEFYKINHPEIIEAGAAVDRLTPKDSLVIADYFGDTAFLYQTKRRGWPVVELPIDELIAEGAEYYASVNLDNSQTKEFMQDFEIIEKTDKYVVIKLD